MYLKHEARTTPMTLKLALGAVLVASGVWASAAASRVDDARRAVRTVGKDCVPSIVTAQELRAFLSDASARAATAWISRGALRERLWAEHDRDLGDVAERVVTAASNMSWPDETRALVVSLSRGVQVYAATVAAARERGYEDAAPVFSASAFLHAELLPAAESLDRTNLAHLDSAWAAAKDDGGSAFSAARLVLLATLVVVQVWLAFRFKRALNAPLLGATFLVLVGSAVVSSSVDGAMSKLKAAKEGAFDSSNRLWAARAAAADASGEESLSLLTAATSLESASEDSYEIRAFEGRLASIANVEVTDRVISSASKGAVEFDGALGAELGSPAVTPAGRTAEVEALRWLGAWRKADREARALEATKHHADAVALRLSEDEGGIDRAYRRLDHALSSAQAESVTAFEASVAAAFDELDGLARHAPTIAFVACLLAWAGIRARMAEYRG